MDFKKFIAEIDMLQEKYSKEIEPKIKEYGAKCKAAQNKTEMDRAWRELIKKIEPIRKKYQHEYYKEVNRVLMEHNKPPENDNPQNKYFR